MKIGARKLRMSDGSIRTFKSSAARARFERVAQAVKHGWKPTNTARKKALLVVSRAKRKTKKHRG